MHAGTEQLLTIRDGEPVDAATRRHVDGCARCRERLAAMTGLRAALRAMPEVPPPAATWARIERELDRQPRRPHGWLAAGAAAAALLAAVVWQASRDAPLPSAAAPDPAADAPLAATAPPAGLDELVQQSRRLEQLLRALDSSTPRVMNAGTAGTIAGLQDGIAVIDYGLSRDTELSDTQSEELWQRRVDLMNTLVQVRGAQVQQVANLRR